MIDEKSIVYTADLSPDAQIVQARVEVRSRLQLPRDQAAQVEDWHKRERLRFNIFKQVYGYQLIYAELLRGHLMTLAGFARQRTRSADEAFAVQEAENAIRALLDDLDASMRPREPIARGDFPAPVPPSRWQEQWKERGRRRREADQRRQDGDCDGG